MTDIAKKQQSQFLYDLQFMASIAQPPFEPKLLRIELPASRRYSYCSSQLEQAVNKPIFYDNLLGIPIDIIDEDTYKRHESLAKGTMLPEDARLFVVGSDEREKAIHTARNWMLKGALMQNNIYDRNTKNNVSMAEAETREAIELSTHDVTNTRDEQIKVIEEGFDVSRHTPKHPTKPNLTPVQVLDILPHEVIEGFTFCKFDVSPTIEIGKAENGLASEHADEDSRTAAAGASILRSYNGNYHGMYVPTGEADEDAAAYKWLKEYRLMPTLPVAEHNNFLFIEYDNEILYSRYHHRHNLRKRRMTHNDPDADVKIMSRPKTLTLDFKMTEEEEEDMDVSAFTSSSKQDTLPTEADLFGEDSDDETPTAQPVSQASTQELESELFGDSD